MISTIQICGLLLAFGTQVVLSFKSITFSSVKQCEEFVVKFSGGTPPPAQPAQLTVIPFNSNPISIPISISSLANTTEIGAKFTFLPLFAGSTFVASLDDENGNAMGPVSDIIKVQPSKDSSCLPSRKTTSLPVFFVDSDLDQCQPFSVYFDKQIVQNPPSIRGFTPRGIDFRLNSTGDGDYDDLGNYSDDINTNAASLSNSSSKMKENSNMASAKYVMDAFRGSQVVLLLDDGAGHTFTSNLTTVGGDSTSANKCFESDNDSKQSTPSEPPTPSTKSEVGSLSNAAKAVIGVITGCVVGLVAVIMAFYIRKRIRANSGAKFNALVDESQATSSSKSTSSFYLSTDIYLSSSAFSGLNRRISPLPAPMPSVYLDKGRLDLQESLLLREVVLPDGRRTVTRSSHSRSDFEPNTNRSRASRPFQPSMSTLDFFGKFPMFLQKKGSVPSSVCETLDSAKRSSCEPYKIS